MVKNAAFMRGGSCRPWSRKGVYNNIWIFALHNLIYMYMYIRMMYKIYPNFRHSLRMIVGAIFPQAKMALIV